MATFGNTVAGASGFISDNDISGTQFVLSEPALVSKLTAYCSIALNNVNNQTDGIGIIYTSGNSFVARTTVVTVVGTAGAWYDFQFGTPVNLAAGTYWLTIFGAIDSDQFTFYGDTDATVTGCRQLDVGYPAIPTTLTPGADNDRKYSIYATYTTPPATAWLIA